VIVNFVISIYCIKQTISRNEYFVVELFWIFSNNYSVHFGGKMSIARVAELSGVPYSTTWRVINRSPGVSAEAALAVRKAMEQIGYAGPMERRGKGARTNGKSKHRNIALLYMRESTFLSMSILREVQRILIGEGLNLIFGHVAGAEDLPPAVAEGKVDGILGYGEFPATATNPTLQGIPAVWMMSPAQDAPDSWGDRVLPDNRAIGRLAARYLLDQRHRHLGFLDPTPGFYTEIRGRAFSQEAEGKAMSVQLIRTEPISNSPVAPPPSASVAAIERAVEQWAVLSPRPTGLFVPTDAMSVVVYRRLAQLGVRPGQDVQIISCDNQQEHLSLLHPAPESIDLSRQTIARLAVERLLWRMKEGNASPPVRITVSPVLNGYRA
jgi:DNA-binding LacI/PurR family transcriptional regulator